MRTTIVLISLLLGVAGCSSEIVLLNERGFQAPAGYDPPSNGAGSTGSLVALPIAGCTAYHLGDGSNTATSDSDFGVVIKQQSEDSEVVVDVNRGAETLVERRYDETFFASGAVDEFAVPASSGSSANELVLRYWGSVDPVGAPDCPPLSDEGP
ncbi:MAG TPA: hypothetical protein VGM56_30410 [Byssovorax sp.]|jgi:hypothetical protein